MPTCSDKRRIELIAAISAHFDIPGRLVSAELYGGGHIHDSFVAAYEHNGDTTRFFHQRINSSVFSDPVAVMENIQRVTSQIRTAPSNVNGTDVARRVLTVVTTKTGLPYLRTNDGEFWRTYQFVEGTRTYQTIESPDQAHQAARAFGQFQRMLAGLSVEELTETIPDFHNTPQRFHSFREAVFADRVGRLKNAQPEVELVLRNEGLAYSLINLAVHAGIPARVTHNDTKLNNVLFDATSCEAICVVDLDTVMPGLSLYDFGDMVRTMTCTAAEDERDLSRVFADLPLFEAITTGYLGEAATVLTRPEQQSLVDAGLTIIFEQAIRFLTDHLEGDKYYKTSRQYQNLDRCRTQLALLQSILDRRDDFEAIVKQHANS